MNIAIALYGDEVSPRFGCSGRLLLASIDEGRVVRHEIRDVGQLHPWQWPELLSQLQVRRLVCGGIHQSFQESIEARGIEVLWGVIGRADEALRALANGTLRPNQFVCPGRMQRGRRRARGGGV